MTIDLKAIRERCAAATKGPWKWGDGQHEGGMLVTDAQPFVGREELQPDPGRFDSGWFKEYARRLVEYERKRHVACGNDDGSIDFQNDADTEFVVQARSDMPALLDLVDQLTRALVRVEWTTYDDVLGCDCCEAYADRSEDHLGYHEEFTYSQTGHVTDPQCAVDSALTAAGLDTREKRDEARKTKL